ncbi:MAG: class I SAM-dependent methyltransferase [Opitutaceae bacterium]
MTSTLDLETIVESVAALPHDWHRAGTMPRQALEAIARRCRQIAPVNFSLETGSGKSTLLFSHFSNCHKVFAVEDGNGSITKAKASELLAPGMVEFIEGPTQITLPKFSFPGPVDIALIDGPHGYPFPDLEYFHIYPHIRTGGILLVDDIQIPTIERMFSILKADKMWRLLEVVDNLAVFERTDHEGVSPTEDGWWKQGFNELSYNRMLQRRRRNNSFFIKNTRKVMFKLRQALGLEKR